MRSMAMLLNKRTALMMKAIVIVIIATGFRVFIPSASAAVYTWNANTTGDWFIASNWTNGVGYPGTGDVAQITNVGSQVILTNSVGWLSALTIGGATNWQYLVFSNWDTCLSATNIIVNSNGYITCAGPFTNNAMSNRVYLACSSLTVQAGGYINVAGKGYDGGTNVTGLKDGQGPGGGKYSPSYGCFGGSYGGAGGSPYPGGVIQSNYCYGSANAPLDPGSGGGAYSTANSGFAGGGAIRIVASGGSVVVNGTVSANGDGDGVRTYVGAGSGGGIYITCNTFSGTNGTLSAKGSYPSSYGAGGGGGRIAVDYDPTAQSNCPLPQVTITTWVEPNYESDIGTIWFPDTQFLMTNTISRLTGQIIIPGFTNWSPASLTITNCWIRFPVEGFQLNVAGNFVVRGTYGRYDVGGAIFDPEYYPRVTSLAMPVLNVGGDLILTNGSSYLYGLYVFSGLINAGGPDYGALVSVTGNVRVYNKSYINYFSHPTNGGSPLFRMQSLYISTNSGFRGAKWGSGYRPRQMSQSGLGPGGGARTTTNAYGGSYGGRGGNSNVSAAVYGSDTKPLAPGSAGGGSTNATAGGTGGGLIRIEAVDRIELNGSLNANGCAAIIHPSASGFGGGGSGGGIYLRCNTFVGSTNALLSACGGNGFGTAGGGGGGGRIAVWRQYDESTSASSNTVSGGTGGAATTAGADGTIYWGWIRTGTIFMFR